ncbi:L,D-transpeptidase family protein [Acidithiobacillus acidisediminis]|uniref:L,D-transpeptidase family protein n=1 Tax=Acidithiobacillus acidisediminis TaxID=2937799 RepID=UPI00200F8BFC
MKYWQPWLAALIGVALLGGCAAPMPPSQVHSVAYYAARIPPPPAYAPAATTAPTQSAVPQNTTIHIVINADQRTLSLYRGSTLLTAYPVAIGFGGSAPRRIRGDDKTPLGHYHIGYVRWGTQYGPFMLLTYPNRQDAEWGLQQGIITHLQYQKIIQAIDHGEVPPQNTPLGGYIGIHGMGPSFSFDRSAKVFPGRWTAGCVALSNHDAQNIAELVEPGTPVEIVGKVASYAEQIGQSRRLAFQYRHVADHGWESAAPLQGKVAKGSPAE